VPDAGGLIAQIEDLERAVIPAPGTASWFGLLFGEIVVSYRTRLFARQVRRAGLPADQQQKVVRLTLDRVVLLRRVAYLEKTKAAFTLWHVFHLPLVWVLLAIAAVHIGLAVYLGYVPFRWSA
jgi:hypothetical protein